MSLGSQLELVQSNHFESPVNHPEVVFKEGLSLAEVERIVILETLRTQNFNRTRAARVLGIGIRTLQRKIKEYRMLSLAPVAIS